MQFVGSECQGKGPRAFSGRPHSAPSPFLKISCSCAHSRGADWPRPPLLRYRYESSVAFGMRKALQAEQGKSDMENRIVQLEGEKKGVHRTFAQHLRVPRILHLACTHHGRHAGIGEARRVGS